MHLNILMARFAVFIQSNGKYRHQIYGCIYNPQYVCITRRCRSGYQRKKNTDRAFSVRASELPFLYMRLLLQTELATNKFRPNAEIIFGLLILMAGRFSAPFQTGPAAHPGSCRVGTGSLSRRYSGRVVTFTTNPI
jgi:1,2-phenylacetyl-CoA epoxidase PaaB subunit